MRMKDDIHQLEVITGEDGPATCILPNCAVVALLPHSDHDAADDGVGALTEKSHTGRRAFLARALVTGCD